MKKSNSQDKLNSVEAWLLLAKHCQFNTGEMSRRCQITIRQLERQCQKALGHSPQEWLNQQRMLAAQRLLLESDSIKSVAYELGYKQGSHFCREFKKYYQMTPSQFVSRQLGRNRI